MHKEGKQEFDIAIIGAGPGGIATVLSLFASLLKPGLRVALLDKSTFPREKVCGDAVPFWVFRDLNEIIPGIHDRMLAQLKPGRFTQTRLSVNSRRSMTLKWSGAGYMIPRKELDDFLLKEVRQQPAVEIIEDCNVSQIVRVDSGFSVRDADRKEILKARYIVGADGAPSTVVRSLRPGFQQRARSGSAVRGYFSNLKIEDPETSLVFYDRKYAPGYFWFFPLSKDRANVGFGMGNKWRQRKNINLNEAFWEFVREEPVVSKLLCEGQLDAPLKGGMLPFSKGVESVIGKGYALVGDAANLNDPFSGDGIWNAVISGTLLGKCLASGLEGASLLQLELQDYQNQLAKKLHHSLRYRARLVRWSSRMPFLVDWAVRLGDQKWIRRWIGKWI